MPIREQSGVVSLLRGTASFVSPHKVEVKRLRRRRRDGRSEELPARHRLASARARRDPRRRRDRRHERSDRVVPVVPEEHGHRRRRRRRLRVRHHLRQLRQDEDPHHRSTAAHPALRGRGRGRGGGEELRGDGRRDPPRDRSSRASRSWTATSSTSSRTPRDTSETITRREGARLGRPHPDDGGSRARGGRACSSTRAAASSSTDTRSSVPHIYAVGDTTMDIALVNVAELEGRYAVEKMFELQPTADPLRGAFRDHVPEARGRQRRPERDQGAGERHPLSRRRRREPARRSQHRDARDARLREAAR